MQMLFAATLLAAAVVVRASSSSSSSSSSESCVPTVSTAPVPSSIVSVLASASYYYPSVFEAGTFFNFIELSSPTVALAESTIEYYEQSYSSVVSELDSIYYYPSLYTSTYVSEFTSAYSSLAAAVSYIYSVELTQPQLALYQSSIQSLEVSYSTILTDLYLYTGIAYPTLYSASQVISEATLTDSSIFASILAVATAVSSSPTVSSAVYYLSYSVYTLPETVVSEIITIISSPSTVGSSTVSSLESCYSTVYSELGYVTVFTYYYPSVVYDLTAFLSAAYYVSSLGSAVYTIVSYDMPTFSYEVSVISAAASTLPSLTVDLQVLATIEAISPTIYYAESTIEASMYASSTVAYSIYYALNYPSLVTDPTTVAYEEESHESFVSAVSEVIAWTDAYSGYSSELMLTGIEPSLISAFASYRTLLTAYSYVEDVTSPSVASASVAMSAAISVVPSLTYYLSSIEDLISYYPSLSGAEGLVEYYAEAYPSVVTYLWSVVDGQYYVATSSASSFASLAASYTTIDYEMHLIAEDESSYPGLMFACEPAFLDAAASDSSLLTQYETMSSFSEYAESFYYTWTPETLVC